MYSLLPGSGGIGENVEGWVGVDGAGALVSPGRKGPTKFQDITVNEHTPLCSLEFHAEN